MKPGLNCAHCGKEIPIVKDDILGTIQPLAVVANTYFHIECGLRVFDHHETNGRTWTYVPKGKRPVYEGGKFAGMEDDIMSKTTSESAAKNVPPERPKGKKKKELTKSSPDATITEMIKKEAELMRKENEKD